MRAYPHSGFVRGDSSEALPAYAFHFVYDPESPRSHRDIQETAPDQGPGASLCGGPDRLTECLDRELTLNQIGVLLPAIFSLERSNDTDVKVSMAIEKVDGGAALRFGPDGLRKWVLPLEHDHELSVAFMRGSCAPYIFSAYITEEGLKQYEAAPPPGRCVCFGGVSPTGGGFISLLTKCLDRDPATDDDVLSMFFGGSAQPRQVSRGRWLRKDLVGLRGTRAVDQSVPVRSGASGPRHITTGPILSQGSVPSQLGELLERPFRLERMHETDVECVMGVQLIDGRQILWVYPGGQPNVWIRPAEGLHDPGVRYRAYVPKEELEAIVRYVLGAR